MRREFISVHDAHRSLRHAAHCLRVCPEHDFRDAYVAVMKAAEHSIVMDHVLMDSRNFPATRVHLEQHARVLRALHCIHTAVIGGATGIGHRVGGQLLIEWFRLHNETLDTAVLVWASYCRPSLMEQLQHRSVCANALYGTAAAGSASSFGNRTHN